MEHHRGIATKVQIPSNLSVEEYAKILLKDRNKEIADYYSSAIECLCDVYYGEFYYHVLSGNLYRLEDSEQDEDEEDIVSASVNNDGTISYEIRFYNGGAGFDEVLEEAFDTLDTDQLNSKYENPTVKLLNEFTDWLRDCGEEAFYVFDQTDEAIDKFLKQK
jgi:hypothetical protein